MSIHNNNQKYMIQIYSCPCNLPTPFFSHNWIVIIEDGKAERWEAGYMKNIGEFNWDHLRKNVLGCSPFDGITIVPGISKRWKGKLIGSFEGDTESVAYKMVQLIRNSPKTYPYISKYFLTGPNSNTYVQWVLNNFPEWTVKLPSNAIGKNYV